MSNEIVVKVDPHKAAGTIKGFDQNKIGKFIEVVQRAHSEKPTAADIRELRKWLADYPGLWRSVFDMAEVVQTNLIRRMVAGEAAQIALEENALSIRDDFGYDGAPVLERLLIDNIVMTWLRNQWAEYQLVALMGNANASISSVEFWERRLSVVQHRHLLACQALAKIRRLSSKYPNLQVNIATQSGQQVNVAGDLGK